MKLFVMSFPAIEKSVFLRKSLVFKSLQKTLKPFCWHELKEVQKQSICEINVKVLVSAGKIPREIIPDRICCKAVFWCVLIEL